jgi:hypothetical protein
MAEAPFTLDVAEVQQLLGVIAANPLDQAGLLRLLDLYTGELLPSCYSVVTMSGKSCKTLGNGRCEGNRIW